MLQEVKVVIGITAVIVTVLIVSAIVWMATTVNQLKKDKDRIDLTTQKLAERADSLTDKVKTLDNQNFNAARDLNNVRRDTDALNMEVGELITATGRQLQDIKKVVLEEHLLLNDRISTLEQANEEYSKKVDEMNRNVSAQKSTASAPQPAKKKSGRIFVDVNNPMGPAGWQDQYTVQLSSVMADKQNFLIDWFKPEMARDISPNKPVIIKKTPKFKNTAQLYFFLILGDTADNRIAGVIDFAPTKEEYYPFDLYLDRDRDGDLAEDLISDVETNSFSHHAKGIKVFYKDGTTEEYAAQIYTGQGDENLIWYASEVGRYGVLEANKKRIGILVLDTSGNGLFNDADDEILIDWDIDGSIDGSSQAKGARDLFSVLDLQTEKYRITEIDPAGHRLTLSRMH